MADAVTPAVPAVDPGQAQNQPTPGDASGAPAAGGEAGKWYDTLPESLKSHEAVKGFQSADDWAKDYLDIKAKVDGLPKPPDSADKYKLNVPDGVPRNEAAEKRFLESAHKMGLTQEQVDGLTALELEGVKIAAEMRTQQLGELKAKTENDLKQEWGQHYERNMNLYLRAYNALASDKIKAFVTNSGLEHDAEFVRLFQNIGSMISEDRLVPPGDKPQEDIPRMPDGRPMLRFKTT